MHSSFRSKKLTSTVDNTALTRRLSTRRVSSTIADHGNSKSHHLERLELRDILEDQDESWVKDRSSSDLSHDQQRGLGPSNFAPWMHETDRLSTPNSDIEQGKISQSTTRDSMEEPLDQGLWPPPRRSRQ